MVVPIPIRPRAAFGVRFSMSFGRRPWWRPVHQLEDQRLELVTGVQREELSFLVDQEHGRNCFDAEALEKSLSQPLP